MPVSSLSVSRPKPREYTVTLSASGDVYLLALDAEHAAWSALELSLDREEKLLNVKETDAW